MEHSEVNHYCLITVGRFAGGRIVSWCQWHFRNYCFSQWPCWYHSCCFFHQYFEFKMFFCLNLHLPEVLSANYQILISGLVITAVALWCVVLKPFTRSVIFQELGVVPDCDNWHFLFILYIGIFSRAVFVLQRSLQRSLSASLRVVNNLLYLWCLPETLNFIIPAQARTLLLYHQRINSRRENLWSLKWLHVVKHCSSLGIFKINWHCFIFLTWGKGDQ